MVWEVGMYSMVRVLVGIAMVAGLNGGACADENTDVEIARLRDEITALVGPIASSELTPNIG